MRAGSMYDQSDNLNENEFLCCTKTVYGALWFIDTNGIIPKFEPKKEKIQLCHCLAVISLTVMFGNSRGSGQWKMGIRKNSFFQSG